MKRSIRIAVAAVVLLTAGAAFAAEDKSTKAAQAGLRKQLEQQTTLDASIRALVLDSVLPLTSQAEWVKAVEDQNALNVPINTIKAINKSWDTAEDEPASMAPLRTNACAKEVAKLMQRIPNVKQVFVRDNQGASVCQNTMNKPFWYGEHDSWKAAYSEGNGGVFVEAVALDRTANRKLQHITLPVLGNGGKAIGAVTFGIATG